MFTRSCRPFRSRSANQGAREGGWLWALDWHIRCAAWVVGRGAEQLHVEGILLQP